MAYQVQSLKCPSCGATLNFEGNQRPSFCSHCGTRIVVTNENESVTRIIDEAQVIHEETEQQEKIRQAELQEKRMKDAQERKQKRMRLMIALIVAGVVLIVVGSIIVHLVGDKNSPLYMIPILGMMLLGGAIMVAIAGEDDDNSGDKIRMPGAIKNYRGKSYTVIETILKNAGFTNVCCIPMNDLSLGLLKRPGTVESVTVSGDELEEEDDKFPADVPIIISYHSFAKRE